MSPAVAEPPCLACGACCAFSADWPRFSTESEAELALIPATFAGLSGMRCVGARCSALDGVVGEATRCGIYTVRPEVCRTCEPGDESCATARRAYDLPALPSL
jgi:hypothetical protein